MLMTSWLEIWDNQNVGETVHLMMISPRQQYRPGRSTSCKAAWQKGPDDLWVLVDNKLTMSQESALGAKMANSIQDGMKKTIAGRWSRVNFPLCSPVLKQRLECCSHKDKDRNVQGQI